MKDILVFAGKQIGFDLLEFLIDMDMPIGKVIAASDNDKKIIELSILHNIPVLTHSSHTEDELLADRRSYSWLLNLWSPHILKKTILSLGEHRLNVHPGLVPNCRGQDCAAWAIRKSLPAGVTLMEMTEGIDDGDIYIQKEVSYKYPITGKELHERLQFEAIELFQKSWPLIYDGLVSPYPQVGPVTSFRRKDTEADRVCDASQIMSLEEFMRWALAHDFKPGTSAVIKSSKAEFNIMLEKNF
jgi:methionyl-tRNA formyltransferase